MKNMLVAALSASLVSSPAFAGPWTCNTGQEPVFSCIGVKSKENHRLAEAFIDAAMICRDAQADAYQMYIRMGDGFHMPPIPVETLRNAGSIQFVAEAVEFAYELTKLSVGPRVRPNARFDLIELKRNGQGKIVRRKAYPRRMQCSRPALN